MIQLRYWLTIMALLLCSKAISQNTDSVAWDVASRVDTVFLSSKGQEVRIIKSMNISQISHSPHTATMYAAVVPGLGQIYNRKYWKLPIIYGGMAALAYSIHFNGKYYDKYRRAYRDFIVRDPNNKSYEEIVKKTNLTVELVETTYASWFTTVLRNKKDYYRRYRDLSYFGMIGVYVIQIVDAAVDAHFFDFNVDDNISMNWQPMIAPEADGAYMGASVTISF